MKKLLFKETSEETKANPEVEKTDGEVTNNEKKKENVVMKVIKENLTKGCVLGGMILGGILLLVLTRNKGNDLDAEGDAIIDCFEGTESSEEDNDEEESEE